MAVCPECTSSVPLVTSVALNEIVVCPHCRAELEVFEINPVQLVLAPEVEEDWGE